MPKLKTHSGTKKRVRITTTGKAVHDRSTGNHFQAKKSAARKRRINSIETFTGKSLKNIKSKLGV